MYSEQGINNTINISTTSLTNATQLTVIGNNNSVYIGNNCKIVSSNIRLKGNNITLFIADDVEIMGLVMFPSFGLLFTNSSQDHYGQWRNYHC